ncbi:MAG: thymidylate kinase [Aigarchaeota archaeon]|nr:thymidylate kinase [Aigarchaeota archaeon]MDW8092978.1 dTMP kinase [Nitrososphaerota archaeon]
MIGETYVVVWEGTDASGKTTLINSVEEILRSLNFRVAKYKTPSETQTGRFAATYGNEDSTDPLSRMLLFLTNTIEDSRVMREIIRLERPDYFFIDRYYLCSIVYGLALISRKTGIDTKGAVSDMVREIERLGAGRVIEPDVYFIVDVNETERLRRAVLKDGHDKKYEVDSELQAKVRELYRELDEVENRIVWIDNEPEVLWETSTRLSKLLIERRKSGLSTRIDK